MMAIVVRGDALQKDDVQKAFDQIEEVDAVVSTIGGTPADPLADSQVGPDLVHTLCVYIKMYCCHAPSSCTHHCITDHESQQCHLFHNQGTVSALPLKTHPPTGLMGLAGSLSSCIFTSMLHACFEALQIGPGLDVIALSLLVKEFLLTALW